MSKRPKNRPPEGQREEIRAERPRAAADGITSTRRPPAPGRETPDVHQRPARLFLALWAGLIAVGIGAFFVLSVGPGSFAFWDRPGDPGRPGGPPDGEGVKDPQRQFWDQIARQARRAGPRRPKWTPPEWKPATAEDQLVDRFVRLRGAGDPAAWKLLGPAPPDPDTPIPAEDVDRVQTDFFLRLKDLRVEVICRCEPNDDGSALTPAPSRYTLLTRGLAASPLQAVQGEEGPTQRNVFNPPLVVEVSGGRIHGVRPGFMPDWP